MSPIARVTIAYMVAAYDEDADYSLDDVISYTEQVANSLFHGGKAEVYKAVTEIIAVMHESNERYHFYKPGEADDETR